MDIDEILVDIYRGSDEIIGKDNIRELIKNYYEHNKRFYIKAGFDPTAPDIHIGHTVLLQKIALFQKHGAIFQFVIGDFTGMIGDPTGKSKTRKKLDKKAIKENSKTYVQQVFKIVDKNNTKIYYNSDWLGKLSSFEVVELASKKSVARMLERDDFSKRFKQGIEISIYEFLYPLFQGYDSVILRSDVELGGIDQKFNLLVGRNLQKAYGLKKEQSIFMMPLLEGLDGVKKMSKSLGNYISIDENPDNFYAKILSISDILMWRYYNLLSSKTSLEVEKLKEDVKDKIAHPKEVKEMLALELIKRLFSKEIAIETKEEFNRVHKYKDYPSSMREFTFSSSVWVAKALVKSNLAPSTSSARRFIKQGAFRVNKERVYDDQIYFNVGEFVLQIGKNKFAKIKVI